ncbi:MAG: hypothetical protein KC620_19755, partial [Myxococcales bacterium]|nr:hypothetical protein [Myxococcales bacterium]
SSYRGPLTPAEVAGRVVVPTGIRFSFELGDGAIGDSIGTMTNGRSTNSFDFFNKGRGDAGKAFGFGDADLDEDHTDLIEDGDLDDGDLHENYGWEVILRPTDDGEIVEADRLKLGDFRFHWFLDSGKSGIGLGPIYRMPPEGFIEGDGQFHGRLWRTAYSSWSIRGGEKKKRFMRATHPLPDAELTKGYRLIVVSVGPVYRKPTALGIG